jgi:hypothetical protein
MTVTEAGASVSFCMNLEALDICGTSICMSDSSETWVRSAFVWLAVAESAARPLDATSKSPKKGASHKVDTRRLSTLKLRLKLRILIFIRLTEQHLPPRADKHDLCPKALNSSRFVNAFMLE